MLSEKDIGPVTPEVAGWSPVAPVTRKPCSHGFLAFTSDEQLLTWAAEGQQTTHLGAQPDPFSGSRAGAIWSQLRRETTSGSPAAHPLPRLSNSHA